MTNEQLLEAILFYKSEPVTRGWLAGVLAVTSEELDNIIVSLEQNLTNRGVCLITNGEMISLGTRPLASSKLEQIAKDEQSKSIGKAGLETLAIILYKGPISRSGIDYIRGVNSQFILRNLLRRGLVERNQDENNARSMLYKPSIELLAHMGIGDVADLPELTETKLKLTEIENYYSSNAEDL